MVNTRQLIANGIECLFDRNDVIIQITLDRIYCSGVFIRTASLDLYILQTDAVIQATDCCCDKCCRLLL